MVEKSRLQVYSDMARGRYLVRDSVLQQSYVVGRDEDTEKRRQSTGKHNRSSAMLVSTLARLEGVPPQKHTLHAHSQQCNTVQ